MGHIAHKISEKYTKGGAREVVASALAGLHARTIWRLDNFLFNQGKWITISSWMLNPLFYRFFKIIRFTEAEHQVGRLMHLRAILKEIKSQGLTGDIVEFGSWHWVNPTCDGHTGVTSTPSAGASISRLILVT